MSAAAPPARLSGPLMQHLGQRLRSRHQACSRASSRSCRQLVTVANAKQTLTWPHAVAELAGALLFQHWLDATSPQAAC
ncbi:MAG: hypothetical protein QOE41_1310 [Mycobacterium sp.]|jgi:hypothetical protein|nr:hypothetical protein [Mycobacterium sp.]